MRYRCVCVCVCVRARVCVRAKKDAESLCVETQGLKAKLELEKKNSALHMDNLKKQIKQIEEDAEAMNQEKGTQSVKRDLEIDPFRSKRVLLTT